MKQNEKLFLFDQVYKAIYSQESLITLMLDWFLFTKVVA